MSITASYYRFLIIHDYTVEYEGNCNPEESSCFVGCEDEECTVEYYYTVVTKHASDLIEQCGADISDCESAHVCLPIGDKECSVTYCDAATEGDACESIDREPGFGDSQSLHTLDNVIDYEPVTELSI